MNIVDIIEEDDVTLSVRVEFSETSCTLLQIHWSPLKDVHHGQPPTRTEARTAIVYDAVGANMLCSHLIYTTTVEKIQ